MERKPTTNAIVEVGGITFGGLENDAYVSLALTKTFTAHKFTVPPYLSATDRCKLNLALPEEFNIQNT